MKLYELIKDVAETSLPDMEITGVTSDTRGEVKAGSLFGAKYEKKAEILGGVILILLGIKTLLEHLGVL